MGEGEGEWERRRIKIYIKWEREREREREWEGKKISFLLWLPSITLPHGMEEREGIKKKCPPQSTLRRVKVFFWEKKGQKGEER
jgi:hypothetical protein